MIDRLQQAEWVLEAQPGAPLLAAAQGLRAWIGDGGTRPPLRTALVRFWVKRRLPRVPVPLTGPAVLKADVPWEAAAWVPVFLTALAGEAEDALVLLFAMERAWLSAARATVAGRRRTSRAATAVQLSGDPVRV